MLPAGKVYAHPVIQIDILPTALAAAGVTVKPDWKLDGTDLFPYLTGKRATPPHEALYWRFGAQMAIRMGDWKLVKAPDAGVEGGVRRGTATTESAHLYNLAADVGEQNNLAQSERQKVEQLTAVWEKWNAQLQEPRWVPRREGRRGRARMR